MIARQTIRAAIIAIRAAGMSVRYSPDWHEFRVTFRKVDMPDSERREAVAAYTDDPEDALGIALAMRRDFAKNGLRERGYNRG